MPSNNPTFNPSDYPSNEPSNVPSDMPSFEPTDPSATPTIDPTSATDTDEPTVVPTVPTEYPSNIPTQLPSNEPSNDPTVLPSDEPSEIPSTEPSDIPSITPSSQPTYMPTVPLKAVATLDAGSDATLEVEIVNQEEVFVTMTVNENYYVGAGFGASVMLNTYAIVAYGTDTIEERKFESSGATNPEGSVLSPVITVLNDSVTNSIRKVEVLRDVSGYPTDYFDFSGINDGDEIDFIWAIRSPSQFRYHDDRDDGKLKFNAPTVEPTYQPSTVPSDPSGMSNIFLSSNIINCSQD